MMRRSFLLLLLVFLVALPALADRRQEITQQEFEAFDGQKFFDEHGVWPRHVEDAEGRHWLIYPDSLGVNAADPMGDHAAAARPTRPAAAIASVRSGLATTVQLSAVLVWLDETGQIDLDRGTR